MSDTPKNLERISSILMKFNCMFADLYDRIHALENDVKELKAAEERRSEWEDEQIERMD